MFDPRLLANTGEQDEEENTQGDGLYLGRIVKDIQGHSSSYLGRIDNEFGPLSEGEEPVRKTDNRLPTKKTKSHHNSDTSSKEPCQPGDGIK